MPKRYLSIWFPFFITDWFSIRQPSLRQLPFVIASPDHGRLVITAANTIARSRGVHIGMVVADARALIPSLELFDDKPEHNRKLLTRFAEWFIRYTPLASINPPDGLMLDITGCAHLWNGEESYLNQILLRLGGFGYEVRGAVSDTIGTSWAVARYVKQPAIISPGEQRQALLALPPSSLRLEPEVLERLQKLGLRYVRELLNMPVSALRRRFGQHIINQLELALGQQEELFQPVVPVEIYHERLPCLEPIVTPTGIEIALQRLLEKLCHRLLQDQKGLRQAILKGYRVDGGIEQVQIGTSRASNNIQHLFKLFQLKLSAIEPALGLELFVLEAPKVEDVSSTQEKLWETTCGLEDMALAELIDRLENKIGNNSIHRYLPDQHHWPERSIKEASSLQEQATTPWNISVQRPIRLLPNPERIDVTAPIPDYPPMLFRYKGKLHTIKKADGPERIEREWWLDEGQHRDYYRVEDEHGARYWLFRSGHYEAGKQHEWFIHGFFA